MNSWKNWPPTVFAIMKDKQQKTWMGTLGSGIYILDANNKELIHLHEDKNFCSNNINQIYKDRQGGLWIATYKGLAYVKDSNYPEQIEVYDEKMGWQTVISGPFNRIRWGIYGSVPIPA